MSIEFEKNLLFSNIYYLMKSKNIKVGELEKKCGVSAGYISRASKDEKSKPGVEFVMNVAEQLRVSVDTLLTIDLSAVTPTEKYLIKFIDKLDRDTRNDKLEWKVEPADYLNALKADPDSIGYCDHPLFLKKSSLFKEGPEESSDDLTVVFLSWNFGINTRIDQNCYHICMKNGATLYLMSIECSAFPKGLEEKAIEIWMDTQNTTEFIGSNYGKNPLVFGINSLYESITESVKHPKIKHDVRYVIDAFMENDDLDDDPDFIPEKPFY